MFACNCSSSSAAARAEGRALQQGEHVGHAGRAEAGGPARHAPSSVRGAIAQGLRSPAVRARSDGSGHMLSICACLQRAHRHALSACLWVKWPLARDCLASGTLSELWWEQRPQTNGLVPLFSLVQNFWVKKRNVLRSSPKGSSSAQICDMFIRAVYRMDLVPGYINSLVPGGTAV